MKNFSSKLFLTWVIKHVRMFKTWCPKVIWLESQRPKVCYMGYLLSLRERMQKEKYFWKSEKASAWKKVLNALVKLQTLVYWCVDLQLIESTWTREGDDSNEKFNFRLHIEKRVKKEQVWKCVNHTRRDMIYLNKKGCELKQLVSWLST